MASPPWLLLAAIFPLLFVTPSSAFGTIGFDFHHRYSDQVKGMLTVHDLPEKGTPHYYAAMSHRDRLNWRTKLRGRGLLDQTQPPLSFADGNETYRLNSLGYLHYANVSVGTPSVSFLVALDTGSDLFWLPCDCQSCVRGLQTSSGQVLISLYSPNASSSSGSVPCSNSLCPSLGQCPSPQVDCKYQVEYLDNGTSSTGVLVEDVLHLAPDASKSKSKPLEAKITFGCGQTETGSFLSGAAPNGLFGLGMSNVSVPSTLAREGYTSNSFSMCFGDDGLGRINFGDTGSSDQGETPFNLRRLQYPTYNISINQIVVGGNAEDVELSAIFDTGTSFTYLNDPAYSIITKNFDSLVKDPRHSSSSTDLPFEYCYAISSNANQTEVPTLDLMMKGGHYFNVTNPIVIVNLKNGGLLYCLGLVKSGNINIIGQNFMTGYRIVFDRERNVLGWRASDCYANRNSNRLPIGPTSSSSIPPATAINPEATDAGRSNTSVSGAGHHSSRQQTSFSLGVVISLVYIFCF
ncbi:Aspartyl protease family protein 1 [Linum perenne]